MRRPPCNLLTTVTVIVILMIGTHGSAASLRSIRQLVKEKEYARARRALEEELPKLSGKSRSEGMLLLARLTKDVTEAQRIYRRIIDSGRARDALRARIELAKIYYAIGEYERATGMLSTLAGKGYRGDRWEAIFLRALCWKKLGDISRARTDLELIDRGDFLYWSYMTLAEIDITEGKIEDAIERYEMIAGGHSNPIAGFKLGECYEIQGDREKALKEYRTLASNFPKSLEAPKAREKIQMIQSAGRTRRDRTPSRGGEKEEEAGEEPRNDGTGQFAFTIQLGAFSERENAIRMAEEIEKITDDVRVERIESGGRIWHRVRVGRYREREEAERYAEFLERKTGYAGKILPR
jgi:tetratricopeptide (TPR) repeat protein